MTNLASSLNLIEKLNNNNYDMWSICIQYYLLGQDLWSIVGGAKTNPLIDEEEKKR